VGYNRENHQDLKAVSGIEAILTAQNLRFIPWTNSFLLIFLCLTLFLQFLSPATNDANKISRIGKTDLIFCSQGNLKW
jgi:hypothetical protein